VHIFVTNEAVETQLNISSGVGKHHLKPVQRLTGTTGLPLFWASHQLAENLVFKLDKSIN
jgi:hypothetical protein